MKKTFALLFFFVCFLAHAQNYTFQGVHFLASYLDCGAHSLTDTNRLSIALEKAIKHSGATILNSVEYHFEGNGFTKVFLLSESHATVHTYPEHNACFVDFFTCGNKCDNKKFHQVLKEYFGAKKTIFKVFRRDHKIKEEHTFNE